MSETKAEDNQSNTELTIDSLFSDGDIDENSLKEKAQKVRRTMRKAKHFSRQDKPLKRSRSFARDSVGQLKELNSFDKGLREGDWSIFVKEAEAAADCIEPFYSYYRSHGKLPEIDLSEALAFVLYVGVVGGLIDLGTDLEMSRDTPRGSYP